MSTIDCSTGQSEIPPVPLGGHASGSSVAAENHIDQDLVQQSRVEIRRLVREITRLCQSDMALDDFYEAFLGRVVSALAAVGGAVWLRDTQGQIRLRYQINLAEAGLAERNTAVADHARLLDRVATAGQTTAVPPESLSADDEASGNPTPWLLLLGALAVDDDVWAIVEVFQRADGGPVTQRGYLRFLTQMCELANDFMKNRRLRDLQRQRQRWQDTERFLGTIHGRLDLQATAYAVANDGRRLIDVDRASVILRQRGRCDVLSISGLDTIEPRADQVRCMARLAETVIRGGESLWYPTDDGELPPQIEQALQRHLDQSHARMVGVIPLVTDDNRNESLDDGSTRAMGAIVVERFGDSAVPNELRRRTDQLARHAGIALSNAVAHRRASAWPLARAMTSLKTVVGRNALTKMLVAAGAVLALIIALVFVPATLQVSAPATLRPCEWRNVFARIDGTVEEVAVQHGQMVHEGQVLARLRSAELEMEIAALTGQKQTVSEQIRAVQRTLLKHGRIPSEQRSRLTAELEQLEQRLIGVESQLVLQRHRREALVVRSPMSGQIVTWDVENALATRPVNRGQILMTVVDPTKDWELDLRVDERDAGHVVTAAGCDGATTGENQLSKVADKLPVAFSLRTYPGQEFTGRIVQVDRTSREDESQQNFVVARARIDASQLPELRSGSTAQARIDCGTRSIGYVWFRDLVEAIHTEVLFWL